MFNAGNIKLNTNYMKKKSINQFFELQSIKSMMNEEKCPEFSFKAHKMIYH